MLFEKGASVPPRAAHERATTTISDHAASVRDASTMWKARDEVSASRQPSTFYSSAHGPQRDHAVVSDASVVARLDALADAAMAYRSPEQAYNDRRQATGYQPSGPLSFGEFEVGRSSMDKHCFATAVFKDKAKRDEIYPHMEGYTPLGIGDPGRYLPYGGSAHAYTHATLAAHAAATHNRQYAAFGTGASRLPKDKAAETPDPGAYPNASNAKRIMASRSISPAHSAFRTKSLQRPKSDTIAPGPGSHRVSMKAVEANIRNSGAAMKSTFPLARLKPERSTHPDFVGGSKSMTDPDVGPLTYRSSQRTMQTELTCALERQSRKKPGFGTKCPQRELPYRKELQGLPGPGDYQPTPASATREPPAKKPAAADVAVAPPASPSPTVGTSSASVAFAPAPPDEAAAAVDVAPSASAPSAAALPDKPPDAPAESAAVEVSDPDPAAAAEPPPSAIEDAAEPEPAAEDGSSPDRADP